VKDSPRTLFAISETAALAELMRDALDEAYVQVRWVRPADATEALAAASPWAIAADGELAAGQIVSHADRTPALVFWLGDPPRSLPSHAFIAPKWRDLVGAARDALVNDVGGMRLAAYSGVDLPGGGFTSSVPLEVLISLHPRQLSGPFRTHAHLNRLLERHGVPWHVSRHEGTSSLERVAAGVGA